MFCTLKVMLLTVLLKDHGPCSLYTKIECVLMSLCYYVPHVSAEKKKRKMKKRLKYICPFNLALV
jgi:hypothetical protein